MRSANNISRERSGVDQLFVLVAQLNEVELAGIVLLRASSEAEPDAKRCILIVDLIRYRKFRLGGQRAPEGDGNGDEQHG
jgi:hypothetical protein